MTEESFEKDEGHPHREESPERPLECTECKKPVAVHYTEVIGRNVTRTVMCASCPNLQQRLHGKSSQIPVGETRLSGGLCCGSCGTTLEAIRMGHTLGCSDCYAVFEDVIVKELLSAGAIPGRVAGLKKGAPIHIGRRPGETKELSPSLQLSALNEALNESLRHEDYEQAAWLRDQINEIQEAQDEET